MRNGGTCSAAAPQDAGLRGDLSNGSSPLCSSTNSHSGCSNMNPAKEISKLEETSRLG